MKTLRACESGRAAQDVPRVTEPVQPPWVTRLFSSRFEMVGDVEVRRSGSFSLFTTSLPAADWADGPGLQRATAQTYQRIGALFLRDPDARPVRIWNFVPRILGPGAAGMDRYMHFNAGRAQAFEAWYKGADFDRVLPAASAVDHGGSDLVVHVLCCREGAQVIANPRQVPPHKYSTRYGPVPPCFSRAVLLPSKNWLVVGGTASVRGEESVHLGDLPAQLNETLENLTALIRAAWPDSNASLEHFTDLRLYVPQRSDAGTIRKAVEANFPSLSHVEFFRAELCRGDLLVEIEGLAQHQAIP